MHQFEYVNFVSFSLSSLMDCEKAGLPVLWKDIWTTIHADYAASMLQMLPMYNVKKLPNLFYADFMHSVLCLKYAENVKNI